MTRIQTHVPAVVVITVGVALFWRGVSGRLEPLSTTIAAAIVVGLLILAVSKRSLRLPLGILILGIVAAASYRALRVPAWLAPALVISAGLGLLRINSVSRVSRLDWRVVALALGLLLIVLFAI
jgi:hypothetical protein